MMFYITREDLKTSIEFGLQGMSPLAAEGVAALREVGETAEYVTVASFYSPAWECGCPLTQAGIYKYDADERCSVFTDFGKRVGYMWGFWESFDKKAMELSGRVAGGSTLLKIVD